MGACGACIIAPLMRLCGCVLLLLCALAASRSFPFLEEDEAWRPLRREGHGWDRPVYDPEKALEHENWADMGAAEESDEAMGHLKRHKHVDDLPDNEPCGARCRHSRREASRSKYQDRAARYSREREARTRGYSKEASPSHGDRPSRQVTVRELHRALTSDKEYRSVKKSIATKDTPPTKSRVKPGHAKKALTKNAQQREKIWKSLTGKTKADDLTPVSLYDSDDEMILRPHSLFDAENPVVSLYAMQTELYTQALTDE